MKPVKLLQFAASATLLALLTVSPSSAVAPPPHFIFDADPAHPIFAGDLAVGAARPAERIQLLFAIRAQATVAANDLMTSSLASLLRETLPGMRVTSEPTPKVYDGFAMIGGGPYGGFVRLARPWIES